MFFFIKHILNEIGDTCIITSVRINFFIITTINPYPKNFDNPSSGLMSRSRYGVTDASGPRNGTYSWAPSGDRTRLGSLSNPLPERARPSVLGLDSRSLRARAKRV